MGRIVTALNSCLVCIVAITAPITWTQAAMVRIQHYVHAGCDIDGRRYLPSGADVGLVATFELPGGSQLCRDAINRMQAGCETATHFQATNPDGHPWRPGEKDPRCLEVFRNEIPQCVEHYALQAPKCEGAQRATAVEPLGPDWLLAENQDCHVFAPDPPPGTSVTWEGDCIDGKATGHGTRTWRDSHGVAVYQGQMHDGKLHGLGTSTYSDGGRHEGEYRNNRRHGHGDLTLPNGMRYQGEFRDDQAHGRGTLVFLDGSRYVGEFRHDTLHGHGTYMYVNGGHFEGEYRNGKPNGYGTLSMPNGDEFKGTWVDGCFEDRGGRWAPGGRYANVHTTPAACGFE